MKVFHNDLQKYPIREKEQKTEKIMGKNGGGKESDRRKINNNEDVLTRR